MTFTNSMRYSVFNHFILFRIILHVKCLRFYSEIKRFSVYESILSFIRFHIILHSTIESLVNAEKFTNALPVLLEYFGIENVTLTHLHAKCLGEKAHARTLFPSPRQLAWNSLTRCRIRFALTSMLVSCGLHDSDADVSCGQKGLFL